LLSCTDGDSLKVSAILQALNWRLQKAKSAKDEIQVAFVDNDLLGCYDDAKDCLLDHLLRMHDRLIRNYLFGLLNTMASFKNGKKYLLCKSDLIDQLINLLISQSHENAVKTLLHSKYGAGITEDESSIEE
jgi:hypothetical protein